ncbi:hypothetical protein SGQ83_10145 [Flavobacterium sp. Fl-318]|uniref:Uncharacterized protein n=1 Tax=Flavobacterium cupriresistens TaxID=2893885 RepID=A0ABU4RAU8_9FLAO|nr:MULTISPECIES: hypothetical protein [unclassified Flavobacterium]MDX6189712.1 hypothetical protein [Flavobacterium sp. Fl-318]UFH40882.1 hypothetical protein LNP23_13810 [Flavobacterium sp. F-323]
MIKESQPNSNLMKYRISAWKILIRFVLSEFFLTLMLFMLLPIVPPKVVAIGSYKNRAISKTALSQSGTFLKLDRISEKMIMQATIKTESIRIDCILSSKKGYFSFIVFFLTNVLILMVFTELFLTQPSALALMGAASFFLLL